MVRLLGALMVTGGLAFAAGEDPLATLRREHPRLIALDPGIQRLRALIRQNPHARRIYSDLVREAEKLQTAPAVEYRLLGPRLLAQSRRCLERIYTLALLYRLDGKRQYLERAVRELRAAAGFKDWNPSHFLDTAEMTHAFAIGYDWLYPALAPEDREWIRLAIIEKGIDPALSLYERRSGWVAARSNWNLVCNSGITLGVLAVADEAPDKMRAVLRYALDSVSRGVSVYAPDGGWPEGPAYWDYATSYTAALLAALESALGTDFGLSMAKGFEHTGRFRVYFSGPSGRTFNYADARDSMDPAPQMFWLARRFAEPVYSWHEHRFAEGPGRLEPLDLLWFEAEGRSPRQDGWPLGAVFHGVQTAFLRSAWDDASAIFLGVKGGDNTDGHAHLDLGSFVLDAGGVRWALDLGPDDYNLPGYFARQRWNYYRTRTESHNTLLIDGENQDTRAEASIVSHSFQPELSYVEIDLSRSYPRRVTKLRRRIGIAQNAAILIQDVLEAPQPVEALWGMITDAEISLNGQTAELKKGAWTLSAEIVSPRHAVFDVVSTAAPAPQAQNAGTRKLVVRLGGKVTDLELNVALIPHKTGEPRPKVIERFGG